MFHRLPKHLEFRQKYSAARRIFNSLLGVWISDETLFLVFDILPEKLTFSISSGHTTTCNRPGSYSLPYSMPSLWKISPNSPFLSGNVTTSTREPFTCAWIRADIWRLDGAICSKNRKIVPYHRCARILRLTVSIPDYGSWLGTSNILPSDSSGLSVKPPWWFLDAKWLRNS